MFQLQLQTNHIKKRHIAQRQDTFSYIYTFDKFCKITTMVYDPVLLM